MSVYFDASVLVALFTSDHFTRPALDYLRAAAPVPIISDFAAAEFASAIATKVRTKALTKKEASSAFADFDAWTARVADRVQSTPVDIALAQSWLRRLDMPLRTPDAVNIAIAQRVGANLATFDKKMALAARAVGVALAKIS